METHLHPYKLAGHLAEDLRRCYWDKETLLEICTQESKPYETLRPETLMKMVEGAYLAQGSQEDGQEDELG